MHASLVGTESEMQVVIAASAVLFIGILTAFNLFSKRAAMVIIILITLTLLTFTFIHIGTPFSSEAVGIASQDVTISTFDIILLAFGVSQIHRTNKTILFWFFTSAIYFLIMSIFVWKEGLSLASGLQHIFTSVLAGFIGYSLSSCFVRGSSTERTMSIIIAGIVSVLALSVLVQTVAVGTVSDGERATGIFGHPSITGKIAIILLMLILPFSRSSDRLVRNMGKLAIVAVVIATVPTLSRANILAVLVTLGAWGILCISRIRLSSAIGALFLVAIVMLPFLNVLLERFGSDPEGGDRPELLAAGLRILASSWATGVGPNNYVFSAIDSEPVVLATGYPVHNTFILAFIELGVVGIVIALVPVGALLIVTVRSLLGSGEESWFRARAVLAALTGFVVVGLTSWGLLQQPILQLFTFVLGISYGRLNAMYQEGSQARSSGLQPAEVGWVRV